MIAYHILCHANFNQVAMLVDALYSEEDVFLIDIDDGKMPDTRAIERFESLPNVTIHRDSNIGWGGCGTLRKTMHGAFRLLEQDSRWEYYVVLSGQDLPLKSNQHIKAVLKEGAKTKTNFIRAFEAPKIELSDCPINNTGKKCMQWGDRGHTKVFAKPGAINPNIGMYARSMVDVAEIGEKGEVYVATVDPFVHKRREAFFAKYPFHTGANWFNLHRSLIEYMVDDPFTYELFDVMRSSFMSDESFFQTYLMNSPFRDTQTNNYMRLIVRATPKSRVDMFEMKDLELIRSTSDLFGRKFDTGHDKKIVKEVLRLCASNLLHDAA